jgi:hypothetical protein
MGDNDGFFLEGKPGVELATLEEVIKEGDQDSIEEAIPAPITVALPQGVRDRQGSRSGGRGSGRGGRTRAHYCGASRGWSFGFAQDRLRTGRGSMGGRPPNRPASWNLVGSGSSLRPEPSDGMQLRLSASSGLRSGSSGELEIIGRTRFHC